MAYSDFKLSELIKIFNLNLYEVSELFSNINNIECSDYLAFTLKDNLELAIAINTEKARSEMIISPILLELRRQLNYKISLFSGVDFNVDIERGLNGICDFIISRSTEQLFLRTPVITVVEAKNENLNSEFGQCIAEMIAAQLFNEREENTIKTIYGMVTIGTIWRFLKLDNQNIYIDLTESYIKDINKILGILLNISSN